ncbi:MAG: glycine zipper 2TM domain-containing protein [Crocinitomicaceae bacterium]|nr:glycine zipper 2TM domain-containing protein [Crocinitomicaceae bacterium]
MPHQNRDEIIKDAIAGGLIGAALGAMLTGKSDRSILAAIVGAAINASLKAQQEVKALDTSVVYEIDGIIYRVHPDGSKEFVKRLPRSKRRIYKREFRLE